MSRFGYSALCNILTVYYSIAVQGIGAGGIMSLTQIILSDIVPLQERGTFNGLVGVFVFPLSLQISESGLTEISADLPSQLLLRPLLPAPLLNMVSGVGSSVSALY